MNKKKISKVIKESKKNVPGAQDTYMSQVPSLIVVVVIIIAVLILVAVAVKVAVVVT